MQEILKTFFYVFGSVASILGLVFTLQSGNPVNATLALISIIIFLSIVLIQIYLAFNKTSKDKYPQGWSVVSQIVDYTTEDGLYYTYKIIKHIQAKRLFLTSYKFGYKWSGSKEPIITSDHQTIINTKKNSEEFDYLELKLHNPVLYDEIEVINVKMELNDTDNKANPFIYTRVDQPIHFIRWSIVLEHKSQTSEKKVGPATVSRKLIRETQSDQDYTKIDDVKFDHKSKSYQYNLRRPEVGYFYKIAWKK